MFESILFIVTAILDFYFYEHAKQRGHKWWAFLFFIFGTACTFFFVQSLMN